MAEIEDVVDVPQLAFKKRNTKSKSTLRKRPATPPPDSASDSSFTSSEDEDGRQIKRRRKNAGLTVSSLNNTGTRADETQSGLDAAAPAPPRTSDNATKASNWYDESASQASNGRPSQTADTVTEVQAPDGTYKGVAKYQSFIQRHPDRAPKQVGPVKGSSNVRTITVTDFAPDVCKDYKQTGFCGFGDSCKFLHAREDYKQGWQLDKDWEIGTNGKKMTGKTVASANRSGQTAKEDDDDAMLEKIPFKCIICKDDYKNPIVTKCGHYFCEACALQRYRKDPSCAACGAGTGGVFNVAKKLKDLLDRKSERERLRKEDEVEKGVEGVDTSKWR